MSDDTIVERVETLLQEQGRTARDVSMAVSGKPDLVRDILRRGHAPNSDNLIRLARELDVSVEYLMGRTTQREPMESEVTLGEPRPEWRGPPQPSGPGIPLVGTGDCASLEVSTESGEMVEIDRSSFDPDYHVRYIKRPPALREARDLYAIYFHGESMLPRFEPGELGIVDPLRHPRPGDYVLVQLNSGDDDEVVSVLVKRLVRQTAKDVVLEQFNPAVTFTVERRKVARIHRIMQQTDLLFG